MALLDFKASPDAHVLSFSPPDFDPGTDFGLFHDNRATSCSESIQTVSPKDIMVDSAPPSTTFTNLTTPGTSYVDSPYCLDVSADTSPLFDSDNLASECNTWPSLFNDDFTDVSAPVHPRVLDVAPKMTRNG